MRVRARREDDEAEAAEAEGYTCGLKDNGEYMWAGVTAGLLSSGGERPELIFSVLN